MGDMADDYDMYIDGELEDISVWMGLDDVSLVELSSATRTPKLMSIRNQALSGKKLSEKQRYCLAVWIDKNFCN